jgi:hypothetical protein
MSTSRLSLEAALGNLPADFKTRLVGAYIPVKEAYAEGQYDACGLRAGKFCEVVLRLLQQQLIGSYTPFGTKLRNFTDECRKLERLPKSAGAESLRIIIPRALDYIYTLRNKRDIGHIGGDVDANQTDAAACTRAIDWCVAELIRIFHNLSLEEAQELIDSLVTRQLPLVWEVGGVKRLLKTGMSLKDQTLCLLYSDPHTAVATEDLASWIDIKRISDYKSRVLTPMHFDRLVEYDRTTETIRLSPAGEDAAERLLHSQVLNGHSKNPRQ